MPVLLVYYWLAPRVGRVKMEVAMMNWDIVEGSWKQFKGKVKSRWGRLTDDRHDVVAGKRDESAGKIQEAHGVARGDAEEQIEDVEKSMRK